MTEMGVLITGATGFIGSGLLTFPAGPDFRFRGAVRRPFGSLPNGVQSTTVGALSADTDWSHALRGMDGVVHTAARVHVMRDDRTHALTEFRRVNVAATLNLAQQAARAGVQRFVFLSSIKVNGDRTSGRPYRAGDIPAPADAYGISKKEAEDGLRRIASETGLEVVIIRPVLVYGPGVKGNFLWMMRCLQRGIPLPLGGFENRRSLVCLHNLVDLIVTTLRHPRAANQTFLVSDGDDLSTTALLRRMASALGTRARLMRVPPTMLHIAGGLVGQRHLVQRLCDSLIVDIADTQARLGWTPPWSVEEALRKTADDFLARDRASLER